MKVKAGHRALPAGSTLVGEREAVWPRWVHTGSSHLRPSNTNTLMKASCGDQDRHLLLLLLLLASVTNLSRSLAVLLNLISSLSLSLPAVPRVLVSGRPPEGSVSSR